VDTTAVSRSPLSGVADNNKFFCGWQKMGIYLESPLSFVEECNSRLAQIAEAYEVLNDEEKCLVDYDMVLQYVYSIQKILKWILVEKTHRQQNVRKGKHDNGASLFSNK
jgi:hypothetical protein